MTITASPTYETSPRDDLIVEIMLLLDYAIEGDEQVSTVELAQQIVELVEQNPLDPPAARALNPTLVAMVNASRAKCAP